MDTERIIGAVTIADLLREAAVGAEGTEYVIELLVFALQRHLQSGFDTPSYFVRATSGIGRYEIARSPLFSVVFERREATCTFLVGKRSANVPDDALDELSRHLQRLIASYGRPLSLITPAARRNDLEQEKNQAG